MNKILNVFCQHGASTSILADAHPHIGTDKLPRVIENMRNTIIECGGEVHFETRMDSLIIEKNKITGIETNTGKTFKGPVILATGHSARDVYRWLAANGVEIEAKGIAVGVRLEHPASLIDRIQYHNRNGRGKYLPAAEYSFVTQVDGRGVYSFCMCPGGSVCAAASEENAVVTNGMSLSDRAGANANSGLLANVFPDDLPGDDVLAGVELQRRCERAAFAAGGGAYVAPAQLVGDFLAGTPSSAGGRVAPTYPRGVAWGSVEKCLPDYIVGTLRDALPRMGRQLHGFDVADAVLTGVETRSSSPVRVTRGADGQSVGVAGLWPVGEGAGYAGGIMSAATDGIMTARKVVEALGGGAAE